MRRLLTVVLLTSLVLLPETVHRSPPASAQEAPASYEGVSPGSGHPPPAVRRLAGRRGRRASASIITWPGFQALPDGGSRFFVQTTGPVTTEPRIGTDRVEVLFRNTTIHLSNSRRWLETRFFDTPVLRARLERRGRDMALVLHLRGASTPRITSAPGEGGFTFTYIDFGAGNWLPAEPEPLATPSGGLGVVSVSPTDAAPLPQEPQQQMRQRERLDDERPPPVQGPNPK